MKFRTLASISLIWLIATSATAESTYWLVGSGANTYVFVNSSTVQKMTDGTIWTWITTVNVGDKPVKTGYKYSISYIGVSCAYDTMSFANYVEYHKDGEPTKTFPSDPTPYDRIIPDTLGEREKEFICAVPSNYTKSGEPLEDFREDLREPVKLADFLYAREHTQVPKIENRTTKRKMN